ncbi:MAG: hypothetical protein A2Y10_05705 [Planctomycetes bacterium GWF2_41_51]|nr:MAG: hypothetical protein A2Y10_05705 [Planctomycetes bacterium GWF2_41_51]
MTKPVSGRGFLDYFGDNNKRRPNILFIMSDDHACQSIGAYGSKINKTPHIDRIANEGAILLKNTCANSICSPSRASILTGKHSHINGVKNNTDVFDGSQQTFPKLLQKAGYKTGIIGKWHLHSNPTGFDHWDILPGQGHYYNPDFINEKGKRRVQGYNTDIITDFALNWMRQQEKSGSPFMLMCNYKAVHRPWLPNLKHLHLYEDNDIPQPPTLFDDYFGRQSPITKQKMTIAKDMLLGYDLQVKPVDSNDINDLRMCDKPDSDYNRMNQEQKRIWNSFYELENEKFKKANLNGKELINWKYQRFIKDYIKCVASLDENIGRLLNYVDQSGIAEETVIIYCSDQGLFLGEHGFFDKRWMYEESLSMPFVIRWPKTIKPKTTFSELTQNIDIAPTLLEIAQVDIPNNIQGRSFLSNLQGKKVKWRKSLYYHYCDVQGHNVAPHEGVFTQRYKLIHFYKTREWEFYDLNSDPYEMVSRYHDPYYMDKIIELKRELHSLKQYYRISNDK